MDEIGKISGRKHITGNRKVLARVDFEKIQVQRCLNPLRRHLWIMLQTQKIKKFIYAPPQYNFRSEKMILEILAFVFGLVYGYVKPGREKRWELFKKGSRNGGDQGV